MEEVVQLRYGIDRLSNDELQELVGLLLEHLNLRLIRDSDPDFQPLHLEKKE